MSLWRRSFLFLLIVGLLGTSRADAQESNEPQSLPSQTREMVAVFTEEPIKVDGVLEEVWSTAIPAAHFYQQEPSEGQPASEDTEVRILYNRDSIYVAIRCFDSEPDQIIARERRRDDPLASDDSIAITLDTFHDHRNAYLFKTNPLGTQYDALITEENPDVNANWDEKWTVATAILDDQWIVEIEIPLKILRTQSGNVQTWGIDFERIIRRKNEFTYWSNYSRDFSFEQISQAGHLEGLVDLGIGERWRIKPFVVTGFTDSSGSSGRETLAEVGLEDLKYRLTSSLTAQFTWNTDFAQTDVDDQRVNLDRFPLFFREKREFFLEGLGNFEVGARVEDNPLRQTTRLFHSRRIGLSERGEVIPIRGGGRLSGRAGRFTVGLLNMWTEDFDTPLSGIVPANSFSVVRIKSDILDRSSVGMFFSSRDSSESFNRVYAIDANLIFWSHLNLRSFVAKSQSPSLSERDWQAYGRIFWDSDFFTMGAAHVIKQPNFEADLGFSPRQDFKKSLFDAEIKPRPDIRGVRQLIFRTMFEYFSNNDNVVQTKNYEYSFVADFQTGDNLRFVVTDRFERVFEGEDFDIGDIPIEAGDYPGSRFNVEYIGDPSRIVTGTIVEYLREWGFWNGGRHVVRLRPVLRLSDKLSLRPVYSVDWISIDGQDLTVHVLNARINYSFTNKWLVSLTAQHSSLNEVTGFNLRLNYIYRPGDDFFIIYNRIDDRLNNLEQDGVTIKFTHSFDF